MPHKTKPTKTSSSKVANDRKITNISPNSSYRERHQSDHDHDTEDSSQESHLGDSQDSTDNTSFISSASSNKRFSPYSEVKQQLKEVDSYYNYRSESYGSSDLDDPDISPHSHKGGNSARKRQQRLTDDCFNSEGDSPQRLLHASPRAPIHSPSHVRSSPPSCSKSQTRSKPRAGRPDDQSSVTVLNCVCVVCVFFAFVLLYTFILAPAKEIQSADSLKSSHHLRNVLLDKFEPEFKSFMLTFPSQSERFWKVLKSTTKRVLRDYDPKVPAVLLTVSNKGGLETLRCIMDKYTELVVKTYGSESSSAIEIEGNDFQSTDAAAVKLSIDERLQRAFQTTKVALIHDVDRIPGEAAMIFHSYCDNEFAPFKDAHIFFTINVDSDEAIVSDNQVESYLEAKWGKQLEKDRVSALIYSRVANSIAVVTQEDRGLVNMICG